MKINNTTTTYTRRGRFTIRYKMKKIRKQKFICKTIILFKQCTSVDDYYGESTILDNIVFLM